MTPAIGIVLVVVLVAMVLFWTEVIPSDTTAMAVMLALVVTGTLTPGDAFAGFGSDTFVMLLGLLILTAALMRTGVVEFVGRMVLRHGGDNPNRLLVQMMIAVATLSAFMSNTAATAFFLPIALGVAAKARVSPSRLLMPMAFASILTSPVTLISSSSNLVVSELMVEHGLAPMGMFELASVGIPIAVSGILYMAVLGRRLVPERSPPADDVFTTLRPYVTEILVPADSRLVDRTVDQAGLSRELDLAILAIARGSKRVEPTPDTVIQADDVLIVEGQREHLLKIKDIEGMEIRPDVKPYDLPSGEGDTQLAELILMPGSRLIGHTLKDYGFRERHGMQVLATNSQGHTRYRKLSEAWLRVGDMLLVQGTRNQIAALKNHPGFRVLGAVEESRLNRKLAPLAVIIFIATLVVASLELLPVAVAVLLGALLVLVTRCITPEEAYREVEWKALVLIACMLALGTAMEQTGTAQWIASGLVERMGFLGVTWILGLFFALTVALTQPMSNQAAAIVILPIALETAVQLGANPRTFAIMVAVAASCSYITPLEPSCLMVYGPGQYKFADFVKVGSLLTLLIFGIAMGLVPRFWPL
jgi:di/tricarboxylate transporter